MSANMPKKRKILNVDDKCRICLSEQGCMSDIFAESIQPQLEDLTKCTSVDIEDDEDLPKKICHVCLYKLEMWSEFKEQFIRSNEMLLELLVLPETADITMCKRKHNEEEQSSKDSLSELPEKKSKSDIPPLIPLEFASVDCVTDQTVLNELYIPEDESVLASKDASKQIDDALGQPQDVKEEEVQDEGQTRVKHTAVGMKVKCITGKRGRTTDRRKASTKRWVARKKALLAATGENASDTDSIASDDTQLSPVQKARAKTNAEKEVERQKRLSKAHKNFESNMSSISDMKQDENDVEFTGAESESRKTLSQKSGNGENSRNEENLEVEGINKKLKETQKNNEMVKNSKGSNPEGDVAQNKNSLPNAHTEAAPTESEQPDTELHSDSAFNPHSVRSELKIGDATYIVTSTLVLSEPHYLNKTHLNNSSQDIIGLSVDENSQERNTDIIDAVQLRRVNPKSPVQDEKKFIERCLNIEVEGTEVEALQRVQAELATFVENDMRHKLLGTHKTSPHNEKVDSKPKDSFQTLDQQLKTIVEKAIKKNVESSKLRTMSPVKTTIKARSQQNKEYSSALMKAALRSDMFQPKVLLVRLDVSKASKHYQINNIQALEKPKPKSRKVTPPSVPLGKRQRVLPAKYCDFNTTLLDSEEEYLPEDKVLPSTLKVSGIKVQNRKTYGPALARQGATTKRMKEEVTATRIDKSLSEKHQGDLTSKTLSTTKKPVTTIEKSLDKDKSMETGSDRHVCGVCSDSFGTWKEIEAHVLTHKVEASPAKQNKHRMMRCKRCHEIVEARYVRVHVCRSNKAATHKCYVCNSTFRTEKLLVRHLETHEESEFRLENVKRSSATKKAPEVASTQQNNVHVTQETKTVESAPVVKVPKQTYTCFVCDKIFTDEEVLKDHLQKHCDDISEDEQSTGKEQYQCAICGETLESEEVLESHVEKHLFDDEDDNPNLISITNEPEKQEGKNFHKCAQCSEQFDSEMLLVMHMQAHEEEAAIAEWEKRGLNVQQDYICVICDQVFSRQDELSEHLDVHNGNAQVCFLCEKPFSTLEDLQKHVESH
ncbi:uncharacterized protein LOC107269979 isoform X2 [Cephus cinctus]|uniref:Uncharacterized protein LOC107269979 isoform X2 n=1 Tax=Cephus cinctus TaxID=211228 RepID=A0AAJ7C2W7_CEPCN|nr:uncharacterized protein LOC107269979 isoform X2 [Cephus cinctus]